MKRETLFADIISLGLVVGAMFTGSAEAGEKTVNLVLNPSFEKETAGKPDKWNWDVSGGAESVCTVDTSEVKFGRSSLKISNKTVDTGNVFGRLWQEIKVKPKTAYTLSCWVKGIKVTGIYWTNWEGWSLAVPDGTYEWKRIQTTFTTKEDQTVTSLGLNTANVTEALYLDGVQFEEGSDAHDFIAEKDALLLRIKTNSDNVNNIFISGKPVRIEFEISGAQAGSSVQMEYKVVNFLDEVVMKDSRTIKIPDDGRFLETVNWSSNQNGVFDIWTKIETSDKESKESRTTFSVTPPKIESGLMTDSPFGITFGIPDLMGYSGIKWTRSDAYWDHIEPEKGRFDFGIMDNHLREANKYGVELLAIIDYSASWASSALPDVPSPERCMYPPQNIDDWKDYVTALVSHYKGKIKAWEIWNEVNAFDTFFKTGSVGKYVELLKAAYPVIKKIDPQAKVIGCVTSGIDIEFIEAVFKSGGFDYMDAVSVHPYRGTRGPEESNLEDDLVGLKNLIDRYGGRKEIWNTEFGWWANDFQPEYSQKGLALTEREQANYLVRSYVIFISSGFEKVFWFTHRHHVEDFAQSVDAGIGLLYHDYKLKPAAVAYRTMTDELEGAVPVSRQKIGDSIEAHLFRKKDKTEILAVWSWKETEVVAVKSDGEYITLIDLMNNRKKYDVSKGSILIPLENGCPVFLEGKDIRILGQIMQVEMAEDVLIPGKALPVRVSLHNLLSEEIKCTVIPEAPGYLNIRPSAHDFVVKEAGSHTCQFQVEVSTKAEFGRKEISFIFNLPGRMERAVKIKRELQIMPAYSVNVEGFEGDITKWKTNDKDAHVVYNNIEKSTDFVKEDKYALHWRCKSPGRWNTITRDISDIDLNGGRQISFWLYMPHAQKGGEQGMGIEILEKDGSKYYHSKMVPLHPAGSWNLIIVNLEDFYLPSFSKDENNRLDPEQLQYFTFNLTAGEFEVYLDGLKVSKSIK